MNNKTYSNFSYIKDDHGYHEMNYAKYISYLIPFKPDIEPRLIYFLRSLFYQKVFHKKFRMNDCIPIYMKYHIKLEDWNEISRYVNKYRIKVFYKFPLKN